MQSPRLVGTFLGPDNALGFASADWAELIVLTLLVPALHFRVRLAIFVRQVAQRVTLCFAVVAILPIVLRLALLQNHPLPAPSSPEEFSYLLLADTVAHGRFANPPHLLSQFFETLSVLQQPTYSSVEPLAQGLTLALGQMLFGTPWAGVLLAGAFFCALCYWMLLGWTTKSWALTGALLAVIEFGPLNEWTNTYAGGAVSAIAGCLVFGALPRLLERARLRDAALLGAGFSLQLLAGPYQFVLLALSAACFVCLSIWHRRAAWERIVRCAPIVMICILPGVALTALQNRQVTGNWLTLPYLLSQQQYGVPPTLTVQPNPVPNRPLTREQELTYKVSRLLHGEGSDTSKKFLLRLEYRVRFYRFFLMAPLYLVLGIFLVSVRNWTLAYLVITLALFALALNLFPYFLPSYIGTVTCLFVLASVLGLRELAKLSIRCYPAGEYAALLIVMACAASFCLFYGAHVFEEGQLSTEIKQYETWNALNPADSGRRIQVVRELLGVPGKQLVFVSYWPNHRFQDEWVYNAADIDTAQIVWAHDLGEAENQKLQQYFPDRAVWLLEPDAQSPKLKRYGPTRAHFLQLK